MCFVGTTSFSATYVEAKRHHVAAVPLWPAPSWFRLMIPSRF